MDDTPFDPTSAVTFELESGRVFVKDETRHALVPLLELRRLCDSAGKVATQGFARMIGKAMAQRMLHSMSKDSAKPSDVSIEEFVSHVGGQFALVGFGTITVETWGSALMLIVQHNELSVDFVAALLSASIEQLLNEPVECVAVQHQQQTSRLLVTSDASREQVATWYRQGIPWHEMIARLHTASIAPDVTP